MRSRTIARHPDRPGPTVSLLQPSPFASFADLEREALACTKCPLAETRTQVVFGVGDPTADLMFVGEGPGEQEDLTGEPFVGRAGRLLTSLIEGIGAHPRRRVHRQRREVPAARQPRPAARRDRERAARTSRPSSTFIDPKVVVTLGNFATKLLLDTKEGITKLRGREFPYRDGCAHPGAPPVGGAARTAAPPLAQARADFVVVKRALAARHAADEAVGDDAHRRRDPRARPPRRRGAARRRRRRARRRARHRQDRVRQGHRDRARRQRAGREPHVHARARVRRPHAARARRRLPARPPAGAARPRVRRPRRGATR